MSGKASGWVWERSPYKGAAFQVHLAMADVVNDMHGWEFWATNAALAAKARVGRQACNEAVNRMVDDGLLVVLWHPPKGQHAAVRYRFLMPDAPVVWAGFTRPDHVAAGDTTPAPAPRPHVARDDTSCRQRRHDHVARDDTKTQEETQGEPNNTRAADELVASEPTGGQLTLLADGGERGGEAPPPKTARLDEEFAEWWAAYPRKVAKPAARRAFATAVKKLGGIAAVGDPEGAFVDGTKRWVRHWRAARTPLDKIPYPATWLNNEQWNDQPARRTSA